MVNISDIKLTLNRATRGGVLWRQRRINMREEAWLLISYCNKGHIDFLFFKFFDCQFFRFFCVYFNFSSLLKLHDDNEKLFFGFLIVILTKKLNVGFLLSKLEWWIKFYLEKSYLWLHRKHRQRQRQGQGRFGSWLDWVGWSPALLFCWLFH